MKFKREKTGRTLQDSIDSDNETESKLLPRETKAGVINQRVATESKITSHAENRFPFNSLRLPTNLLFPAKNKLSFKNKLPIIRILNVLLICAFFSIFFNPQVLGWDEACYISNSLRMQGKTTIFEEIRPIFISVIGLLFGDNILFYKLFAFILIPATYILMSLVLEKGLNNRYKKQPIFYEACLSFSFIAFMPFYDYIGLFMVEIFSVFISFIALILLSGVKLNCPSKKDNKLAFLSGVLFALLAFSRYPFLIFFPIVISYLTFFAKRGRAKLVFHFVSGYLILSILFVLFLKLFLGINIVSSLVGAFFAVENEYAYLYSGGIFYYLKSLIFISPIFFIFAIISIADMVYLVIFYFFISKNVLLDRAKRMRLILGFLFFFNLLVYTLFTHKEPRFLMYMFFYLVCHFGLFLGSISPKAQVVDLLEVRKPQRKIKDILYHVLLSLSLISILLTLILSSEFILDISRSIKYKEDVSTYQLEDKGDYVYFVSDPRYSVLNPDKKINAIYSSPYSLYKQLNLFLKGEGELTKEGYFEAPCAIFVIDNGLFSILPQGSETHKILEDAVNLLEKNSRNITSKGSQIVFYELCR